MICLRNRDHSVIFEIAPKYCVLDSFVDYKGYSIYSKGFLPKVVDIMVIWFKCTLFGTPWTVTYQIPPSMGFSNTGVGCHFLLQGIFLTQGSNLGLPHCRQMLYCLSHQGSPIISINGGKSQISSIIKSHSQNEMNLGIKSYPELSMANGVAKSWTRLSNWTKLNWMIRTYYFFMVGVPGAR